MLYGCATWTMRSQDFSSLRTAHHKLLWRIIGFRRKDRIGYKPLSYREALERTGSERIETITRKRQLGFAVALVRQGDSRFSKRVMFAPCLLGAPPSSRRSGGSDGVVQREGKLKSDAYKSYVTSYGEDADAQPAL